MLISFLLERVEKIPRQENFILVRKRKQASQNLNSFIQRTLKTIYRGTNANTKLIRKSYNRSNTMINIVYTRTVNQRFCKPTEYICKVSLQLENNELWEDFDFNGCKNSVL